MSDIHKLRVNLDGDPRRIPDRLGDIEWLVLHLYELLAGNVPNLTDLTGVHNRLNRQHERTTELDGALSERIDNIEKHCAAMQARWDRFQPDQSEPVKIDQNRTYYSRGGTKITGLFRRVGGLLDGTLHVNDVGLRYLWQPDGRLEPGRNSPEDVVLTDPLHEGVEGVEVKFKAQTVELGVIELQKRPEGWMLWCDGVLQWRSWK